jgi:hypothetical protein
MKPRTPLALACIALACSAGGSPPAALDPWTFDASLDQFTAPPDASARDSASLDVSTPLDVQNPPDSLEEPADASALDADVGAATDADVGAATLDADAGTPRDCEPVGNVVTWTRGNVRVDYDLAAGSASFLYAGAKKVSNFYAGVQLATYLTTTMYKTRTCIVRGEEAAVISTGPGLPTIEQSFVLGGGNHFLARATVSGAGLATNWISPVVVSTTGGVDVGTYGDVRILQVPFDNDAWVSYDARPIAGSGTSYEVAAIYDNVTRNGIVVGSVTHDTWKTGVFFVGSNGRLDAMNVFGGAVARDRTRDVLPHGKVTGSSISSPTVFVGYAPDWRDLMEQYADANLAVRPPLAWKGGVPFGWNSWGKLQQNVSYEKAISASDFVKNNLQNSDFSSDGTVYINLDSYWDNLSSAQLDAFVARCHANGQKAGIYWSPFVDWGKTASWQVDGTSYVYGDVWLKDADGKPIEVDGGYAIDPTHPGTKGRVDKFIDDFKRRGFEYVKLDFLGHGALESTVRFDPTVQTGIQAYNHGMRYVLDRIGGSMFVSASIAPLFPYGYAHARRIACDTYGAALGLTSTRYEMNSASYGWWMNGRLYRFNDPDSMVFEGFSPTDNMSRLVSGVVTGTVFLNGDDLTGPPAQALARAYLTNRRINDVARLGKAFRPVEGNTGTDPSSVLVLHDGGTHYLAVFNFGTGAATTSVHLPRAGIDGTVDHTVTDLWSGATSTARGVLGVSVEAGSARLLTIR